MNIRNNLKSMAGILTITIILLAIIVVDVAASPPTNDNIADATIINNFPYSDSSNTTTARIDVADPDTCGGKLKSIWYVYTPANNSYLNISVLTDYQYLATISIYKLVDGALIPVGCNSAQSSVAINDFRVTTGTTYYFELMSRFASEIYPAPDPAPPSDGGPVTININQILPPVNDDFANATVITESPYSNTVDSLYATNETGEPSSCGGDPFRTIWYSFTPTVSGPYLIKATGEWLYMSAYTGDNLNTLQNISCSSMTPVQILLDLEVGTTYYFQVGYGWDYGGPITFKLRLNVPPDNDNFLNAKIVTGTSYFDMENTNVATTEEGEPNNCAWTFHKTIWYAFTPVESGLYTGSVTGEENYTTLVIYTGTELSNLQMIGCRLEWIPKITMTLEAGTNYYFQILNNSEDGGIVTFNFKQEFPPINDNFANSTIIEGLPFSDSVDTTYATVEPNEPDACHSSLHNTVWYAFTPSISGLYTAESSGEFYQLLAIYTGDDLTNLNMLFCYFDYWGVRSTLWLEAGAPYYYQLFSETGYEDSNINFTLYITPPPIVDFYYDPRDPKTYEGVQFYNNSYDPYGSGIESCAWDFGDGSTAADCYPVHAFTADGDYTVQLEVTTYDGRTAATSQTVQVRTHDVGITKLTAPTSARAGQTKQISVSVKNLYYPETVQVDLYKVTQNGLEFIGSITQDVPIRPPNRAQVFTYNYTFTSGDAAIGKVNFKAFVTIIEARDAFPVDNELISYATKVTR